MLSHKLIRIDEYTSKNKPLLVEGLSSRNKWILLVSRIKDNIPTLQENS